MLRGFITGCYKPTFQHNTLFDRGKAPIIQVVTIIRSFRCRYI